MFEINETKRGTDCRVEAGSLSVLEAVADTSAKSSSFLVKLGHINNAESRFLTCWLSL